MSDQDGIASSAIMHLWLKDVNSTQPIVPIVPEGKVHGIIDHLIPRDLDLLIIPDASTSEREKHEKLAKDGIEICCLDHHILSGKESEYAVTINPHLPDCPYPNKNLSGAGVVLKFLSAVDADLGQTYYTKYFDLAAVATVADVMDLTSMENKAIVNIGLSNIRNEYLLRYLEIDQRLDPDQKITAITVGYYMAPAVNALIRMGSAEEKMDMYLAFVGELNPRPVIANILKLKGKQDRKKEPIINRIAFNLSKSGGDKNKIIIAEIPESAPKAITGLVAGQMTGLYDKPVLLGRPDGKGNWSGSLRNVNDSNLENLKDFCEESGLFNWTAGHQSAAGWSMPEENIPKFIQYCEDNLPKIEKLYYATFSHKVNEDLINAIPELATIEDHVGPGFDKVLISTTIDYDPTRANIIGKKKNVLLFSDIHTGLEFIKFNFKGDLPDTPKTMRVIAKPNINTWNGMSKPQMIVEDFEFVDLVL